MGGEKKQGLMPPKEPTLFILQPLSVSLGPLAVHGDGEGLPPPSYTYQSCVSTEVFTRCLSPLWDLCHSFL